VVIALEYRLHPVTDFLAGTLAYPPGRIPELLQTFVKFVATAPDEMNVVGGVLPSEQGSRFWILVGYCGDPSKGNELLAPLRALKPWKTESGLYPIWKLRPELDFFQRPSRIFKRTCSFRNSRTQQLQRSQRQPRMHHQKPKY
jgi:hypothetical protein